MTLRSRASLVVSLAVVCVAFIAVAARTTAPSVPIGGSDDGGGDAKDATSAFEFPWSDPGALRLYSAPVFIASSRADADVVYSTAAAMIYNAEVEPVEITGWAPIAPNGLRMTGVGLVLDDGFGGGYGGDKGYPPPGRNMGKGLDDLPAVVHPVGHVLDAAAPFTPGNTYFVVIGYAREVGHPVGSVEGVRLTYAVGGDEGELNVPIRLVLCEEEDRDKPCG